MAAGRMAFPGRNAAVIHDAILNRAPTPLVRVNPDLPPELERIVDKALEKDRKLRYQSAADIRTDLRRLKRDSDSGQTAGMRAAMPSPVRRHKWAKMVGSALVITGLAIGGWFYNTRRPHALGETDTVVIADFSNSTGDAVFDDTLKQALGVALRQSPFLNVLSDERIGTTLRQMTKPTSTPLTPDIAREVCQRAGSKAYITGSIANIGTEYVVGLKAVNCQSGDTLALKQVQAAGKEKVLDALGGAATKLRTELGESLSSVQRFDTQVGEATTSSFEALKALSQGEKTWHETGAIHAIPFFTRAIELDPKFAIAYVYLSLVYESLGEESKSVENIGKAFLLRDRVTESEKFLISSLYYLGATGEFEKALWQASRSTTPLWQLPRRFLA